MPEGHTVHRAARLQRRRFAGRSLRVWSPQGRFASEAAELDGGMLEDVWARGKHLFYEWNRGRVVHVHLGLFGRFRMGAELEPSPNARVAWEHGTDRLSLAGPTVCELIDREAVGEILARLGPDPLSAGDEEPVEYLERTLRRRSIPIGAALLDQSIMSGVGNVYRAEILFLAEIDPRRPANELAPSEVSGIWHLAKELLERGERSGRIVTVQPSDVGVTRDRDVSRGRRLNVYKRLGRPCRRCGSEIQRVEMAGRNIWFCPQCQS